MKDIQEAEMSGRMTRRDFIRTGTIAGTGIAVGGFLGASRLGAGQPPAPPDLAVVTGGDAFPAVNKGLEALGGMKRFVGPGSTVGLLINAPAWWTRPGSHTHPDVVLAVLLSALEAGAKGIQYLIDPSPGYWKRSPLAAKYGKEIGAVKRCSGNHIGKDVSRYKTLKKTKVVKEFLDCDVFINLPIIKHHVGVGMSCCLKNMMGVNDGPSNQFFHSGSGARSDYGDVPFLAQCVADLNTLRKPDLCVADATEFLLTNGPAGPGELGKAGKVILGTDPVAVDAYGAPLVRLTASEVLMITKSVESGLGQPDLTKLSVKEITG